MSSKIATQEAINRVAVGIYEKGFVFARQEQYQPRRGTLLHSLWQGKKLTLRLQRAWHHFTDDLYRASGKSGPVAGGYGDSSGGGNPSEFKTPKAYTNAEYRRLDKLVTQLDPEERILLRDLISDELQRKSVLDLEMIGLHRNGYRSADQARAAGVANVCCLLARIATYYNIGER